MIKNLILPLFYYVVWVISFIFNQIRSYIPIILLSAKVVLTSQDKPISKIGEFLLHYICLHPLKSTKFVTQLKHLRLLLAALFHY